MNLIKLLKSTVSVHTKKNSCSYLMSTRPRIFKNFINVGQKILYQIMKLTKIKVFFTTELTKIATLFFKATIF